MSAEHHFNLLAALIQPAPEGEVTVLREGPGFPEMEWASPHGAHPAPLNLTVLQWLGSPRVMQGKVLPGIEGDPVWPVNVLNAVRLPALRSSLLASLAPQTALASTAQAVTQLVWQKGKDGAVVLDRPEPLEEAKQKLLKNLFTWSEGQQSTLYVLSWQPVLINSVGQPVPGVASTTLRVLTTLTDGQQERAALRDSGLNGSMFACRQDGQHYTVKEEAAKHLTHVAEDITRYLCNTWIYGALAEGLPEPEWVPTATGLIGITARSLS